MKEIKIAIVKASKNIDRDLSRRIFSRVLEICFSENERPKKRECRDDGKPIFADRKDIKFSISHSENWYIAAFCKDAEVGVDIEELRPINVKRERIAVRFFDYAEQEALKINPKFFLQIWTKKEAIVKLNGKGIGGLKSTYEDSKKLHFEDISDKITNLCFAKLVGTVCCEEEFFCSFVGMEEFNG